VSGKGVESLIQLLLVLAILKNILLVVQLYRMNTVIPKLSTTLSLGKLALPLILSMLISGSSEMIDGFLVGHFLGNEAFALFRYGARELPLSGILAAAMSQAMVARFAAEGITREGLMTLKKESTALMHVVFPVSILLILLSSWIYPLVFSPAFLESASVFNIYALLVISRMVFPQTIVLALQRHDVIFRISIFELSINVVSSVILMRWFGMEGIAFGTVIAFMAEKCLLYFYVKKQSGIRLTDLLPIRIWLMYTLLLLLAFAYTTIR
jgi:O-antigen/teichoic acid export membrane protein